MSNVLSDDKKQQIIALGRLGWTTRRIERETGIRRETISTYLKEAGVELRPPRGRTLSKPASPSGEVTPDSEAAETAADHSGIDTELSKDGKMLIVSRKKEPGPEHESTGLIEDLMARSLASLENRKDFYKQVAR